jgi:hypothetical protein
VGAGTRGNLHSQIIEPRGKDKFERNFGSIVIVNKSIAVVLIGMFAGLSAACSGTGPTPTRTPRAVADSGSATQTPWFIYVPVTTTPEPFTITPLPTVTSSAPTPKPTNTRAPKPVVIAATHTPELSPTVTETSAPAATPTPSCGDTYQVTQLTFPHNGDTRDAKGGSGAAHTIQFMWTPVVAWQLDPTIGYHVIVNGPTQGRSAELFISHNGYLKVNGVNGVILSQQATYGLTNGDDTDVHWNVTVVKSSGGFDDQNFAIIGTPISCGAPSPTFTVHLKVLA